MKRENLLFILRGGNMHVTTDQVLLKNGFFKEYRITDVVAICRVGATSVACLGGLYTAASKGGSALIAASQSWLGLTAVGKMVVAVRAALLDTDVQTVSPIFSLSTASTAACTADIYVFGAVIS